jgi:hypothetical protein
LGPGREVFLSLFVSGVTTGIVAHIVDAEATIGLFLDTDVMIGVTVGYSACSNSLFISLLHF